MSANKRKKCQDPLVGFLFGILVYFLKHDIKDVSWTKESELVIMEYGEKKEVGGMNVIANGECFIFISDVYMKRPRAAASTMVHELMHCLLAIGNDEKEEIFVRRFERLLWEDLSERQKLFFVHHLPPYDKYSIPE